MVCQQNVLLPNDIFLRKGNRALEVVPSVGSACGGCTGLQLKNKNHTKLEKWRSALTNCGKTPAELIYTVNVATSAGWLYFRRRCGQCSICIHPATQGKQGKHNRNTNPVPNPVSANECLRGIRTVLTLRGRTMYESIWVGLCIRDFFLFLLLITAHFDHYSFLEFLLGLYVLFCWFVSQYSTCSTVPIVCDVLTVGNTVTIIVHFTIEHQVYHDW